MKERLLASLTVAGLVAAAGCSSSVKLIGAKAEPQVLRPGGKGKVIVVLKGAYKKVGLVQATVREYPEYTIRLNDQGRMGDEKAGDGIWSYEFPVPYDAPARKYHLDVTVKDKEGNIIKFGQAEGPATTIVVEIR